MDIPDLLVLHATPHPDDRVRRVGFALDHPYLEQCWAPLLGPSAVLLLRRATWLWRSGTSIAIPSEDLSRSIGLGRGTARTSVLAHTLYRLSFAGFVCQPGRGELDVYTEVPFLRPRQLEKVPAWTHSVHDQLVEQRLAELQRSNAAPRPTPLERPLSRPRTARPTGPGPA